VRYWLAVVAWTGFFALLVYYLAAPGLVLVGLIAGGWWLAVSRRRGVGLLSPVVLRRGRVLVVPAPRGTSSADARELLSAEEFARRHSKPHTEQLAAVEAWEAEVPRRRNVMRSPRRSRPRPVAGRRSR
jgi:hypothetical protein